MQRGSSPDLICKQREQEINQKNKSLCRTGQEENPRKKFQWNKATNLRTVEPKFKLAEDYKKAYVVLGRKAGIGSAKKDKNGKRESKERELEEESATVEQESQPEESIIMRWPSQEKGTAKRKQNGNVQNWEERSKEA